MDRVQVAESTSIELSVYFTPACIEILLVGTDLLHKVKKLPS